MALSTALGINKQIRTLSIDAPELEESRREECINNVIRPTLSKDLAQALRISSVQSLSFNSMSSWNYWSDTAKFLAGIGWLPPFFIEMSKTERGTQFRCTCLFRCLKDSTLPLNS